MLVWIGPRMGREYLFRATGQKVRRCFTWISAAKHGSCGNNAQATEYWVSRRLTDANWRYQDLRVAAITGCSRTSEFGRALHALRPPHQVGGLLQHSQLHRSSRSAASAQPA